MLEHTAEGQPDEQAEHAAVRGDDDALQADGPPDQPPARAAERIGETDAASKLIMLTTFDLDEHVHAALRAGAVGFLLKDTPPRDLAAAVRTVAEGNAMLAPSVTKRLISAYADRRPSRADAARRQLSMSEARVKAHVSRSLAKLGLANRVQAAIMVHDAGA